MTEELEAPRADREPKSKLREEVLLLLLEEEDLDAAIGADLPWGLNPKSVVKRPSKSFIVRDRERKGSGVRWYPPAYGGSAGECGEGRTENRQRIQ